jgi:hypothetical protein
MQWMCMAKAIARTLVAMAAMAAALAGALVLPTAAQQKGTSPPTLPAQGLPTKSFPPPIAPQQVLKAKPLPGGMLAPDNKALIKTTPTKAAGDKNMVPSRPATSAAQSFCRSAAGVRTTCSTVPNIGKLQQKVLSMGKTNAARLQWSCGGDGSICTCKGLADCSDLAGTGLCPGSWYCNQTPWGLICSCSRI